MAFSTIDKSTLYQNQVLYTATGSEKTISGLDFQPSMVWTKNRDNGSYIPAVVDQVRGGTKKLFTNNNDPESTDANAITAWTSDGYTFGSSGSFNNGTDDYVNWCWVGNGSGSANTVGDIDSTVSVNTTSGFSIVQYTGTDVAGDTVGHGLGVIPKLIILKRLADSGYDWIVYHVDKTAGLYLNTTGYNEDSSSSNIWFNGDAPTSTVFSIGTDGRIGDATVYIAYCFAEISGYSKFGSYTGNSSADGPFIYTGFKPAFVMVKRTDNTSDWQMQDNKRIGYNVNNYRLSANLADAETTSGVMDFVSNGFKFRGTPMNTTGGTFIYMAFGQPIISNSGVCANAR